MRAAVPQDPRPAAPQIRQTVFYIAAGRNSSGCSRRYANAELFLALAALRAGRLLRERNEIGIASADAIINRGPSFPYLRDQFLGVDAQIGNRNSGGSEQRHVLSHSLVAVPGCLQGLVMKGDNMRRKSWIVWTLCTVLLLWGCPSAFAQTPTNFGHIGPSGAQIAGAIAGTAAVIGVVLYFVLRKPSITGCTVASDSGVGVKNEKNNRTYVLTGAGMDLKPGRRVKLRGKKAKAEDGSFSLRVKTVVHDYGPCHG